MAGAATPLSTVVDQVAGMSKNLASSKTGAASLATAFESMADKMVPMAASLFTLSSALGSRAKPFSVLMDAAKSSVASIGSHYAAIQKELEEVVQAADDEYHILGHTNGVMQLKEALLKEQLKYTAQQYELQQLLATANEKAVRLAKALAANFAAAWQNMQRINSELKLAASSGAERARLELSVYENTVRTGLSLRESSQAAAALVSYGLESRDTFRDNVKTVSLLVEGLGMSSNEAAHLAAVTEGMVHANFKEVADTIASIVEYTALAADEAARYGRELAETMSILKLDNADKTMPGVLRAIGSYEGALKELTGKSGDFTSLVKKMQSSQGIAQLRVLGISPEMLKTEQGVKTMMDRFGDYATKFVGKTTGLQRAMQLEALASQMGMTTEAVNSMMLAIEKQREKQMGNITLNERAKNQMDSMNKGIERLINRIMALIQGGLFPITWAIGGLANTLDHVIGWITDFKGVMYVAMAGVVGAAIWSAKSLTGVARSAWKLAAALVPTAANIDRLTASIAGLQMASGNASPGGAAGRAGGVLSGGSGGIVGILKSSWTVTASYFSSIATSFKTNFSSARLLGGEGLTTSLFKGFRSALAVTLGPVSLLLAGILAASALVAVISVATKRYQEKQLQKTQDEIMARRAGTGSALRSIDAATQRGDVASAKAFLDKRMRDIEFGRGEFANATKLEKSSAMAELTRRAKDQTTMALYASQRFQQLTPQMKTAIDAAYQGKGAYAGKEESTRFNAIKEMYVTAAEEKRREAEATGSVNAAQEAETLSMAAKQLEIQRTLAVETEKNQKNSAGLRADQRAQWAEEEKIEMHKTLNRPQNYYSGMY